VTTEITHAVFDLKEAADYLHSNPKYVRRWLQAGELAGWRTEGRHWRISRAACDQWITDQEERGRMEVAQ
jgi:excisionase family DNA binding protein